MRRSVAIVVLAPLVVAGACGANDQASLGNSSSAAPSDDIEVLRRYLAALNEGDVTAAMALRCNEARIEGENMAVFADQAERLLDSAGHIEVESARTVPRSGLEAGGAGDHESELEVVLSTSATAAGGPVRMVVLEQDGERRLCGVATDPARSLHRSPPEVRSAGQTDAEPRQLVPDWERTGFRKVVDEEASSTEHLGSYGWTRAWQEGDYGGARVTAIRFDSADEAAQYAASKVRDRVSATVSTFDVESLPGAVGLRYLGYAWLWVQPTNSGPFVDTTVTRLDRTVVVVSVADLDPASDHALVSELTSLTVSGHIG